MICRTPRHAYARQTRPPAAQAPKSEALPARAGSTKVEARSPMHETRSKSAAPEKEMTETGAAPVARTPFRPFLLSVSEPISEFVLRISGFVGGQPPLTS